MARGSRSGRRPAPPHGAHLRKNLALWERQSAAYDRRFAGVLGGDRAMAWGLWRVPESKLRLLGPLRGRDVLELGCGAARWSAALARRGARVVGLDLSAEQLRAARSVVGRRPRGPALVRANAERLPFRPAVFDLVFADWGAPTFCDPHRFVPEVARVLRPGGAFVFATSSPLRGIAEDRRTYAVGRRFRYPYFGLRRLDYAREVNFVLGYAAWLDLFRAEGLRAERLVETRPGPSDRSRYLSPRAERWARSWPLEVIWVAVRSGDRARRPVARPARAVRGR